jgi:hypothetical protein
MSSTRLELLASAAQTASAQGGAIAVGNLRELALCVDVTSVSGSLTAVWLQASSDGGTTWYDLLAEAYANSTSSGTATTSGTWARNVIANQSTGAVLKSYALYKTFGDYVRAAWVIAGSGPSCTFSVKGVGKN